MLLQTFHRTTSWRKKTQNNSFFRQSPFFFFFFCILVLHYTHIGSSYKKKKNFKRNRVRIFSIFHFGFRRYYFCPKKKFPYYFNKMVSNKMFSYFTYFFGWKYQFVGFCLDELHITKNSGKNVNFVTENNNRFFWHFARWLFFYLFTYN